MVKLKYKIGHTKLIDRYLYQGSAAFTPREREREREREGTIGCLYYTSPQRLK